MLRTGYVAGAEEYAILDYSDFCGVRVDEFDGLENISRLAQGIAEHGEAFAQWTEYLGISNMDEVERTFGDAFCGRFESTEAYVEHVLSETGFNERLDEALDVIADDLRGYISIDTEQLARDWEMELHVVETVDGSGVLIFDARQ
jgi:antirestriction protein